MEAVYSLVGVIVGAAVAVIAPIFAERFRQQGNTRRLLFALLAELDRNEYAARTANEQNLTFGYLGVAFDRACYKQATEGGALASIPPSLLEALLNAYDRALRLSIVLSQKSTDMELLGKLLGNWGEVQSKFKVAADGLRQYLGVSK
jgi:hypothetical protein